MVIGRRGTKPCMSQNNRDKAIITGNRRPGGESIFVSQNRSRLRGRIVIFLGEMNAQVRLRDSGGLESKSYAIGGVMTLLQLAWPESGIHQLNSCNYQVMKTPSDRGLDKKKYIFYLPTERRLRITKTILLHF